MGIVVPFVITKISNQPRCSVTDEWIKKWYIHTMGFYSAAKNETMTQKGNS